MIDLHRKTQEQQENGNNEKQEDSNGNEKFEQPNSNINDTGQGTQDNENSDNTEKDKKFKPIGKENDITVCEEGVDIKKLLKIKGKKKRKLYGKRVDSTTQKGKYVKSRLSKDLKNDIAVDATLRAAAISSEGSIKVKSEDITA